jgi:hypothetical protein
LLSMFVYCAGWLKHLNTNILFILWHFVHLLLCYLKQNLEVLLGFYETRTES